MLLQKILDFFNPVFCISFEAQQHLLESEGSHGQRSLRITVVKNFMALLQQLAQYFIKHLQNADRII
jgi:hypothetical protein